MLIKNKNIFIILHCDKNISCYFCKRINCLTSITTILKRKKNILKLFLLSDWTKQKRPGGNPIEQIGTLKKTIFKRKYYVIGLSPLFEIVYIPTLSNMFSFLFSPLYLSFNFHISTECIRDLDWTLIKVLTWLFLCYIWLLLSRTTIF